jgi:hypothetical protein
MTEPMNPAQIAAIVADLADTTAREMLRVSVMTDWQFLDCMDEVDEATARELGVVFANGKGYNVFSDIRNDERQDALVELIKRALMPSLKSQVAEIALLATERNAAEAKAAALTAELELARAQLNGLPPARPGLLRERIAEIKSKGEAL